MSILIWKRRRVLQVCLTIVIIITSLYVLDYLTSKHVKYPRMDNILPHWIVTGNLYNLPQCSGEIPQLASLSPSPVAPSILHTSNQEKKRMMSNERIGVESALRSLVPVEEKRINGLHLPKRIINTIFSEITSANPDYSEPRYPDFGYFTR